MVVVPPWSLLSSIDRLSILFPVSLEEVHRGGNCLCLVESPGLTCASVALPSVVDSAQDLAVASPWSFLSSIDRLSILFPVRLEEGHREGNCLCLIESLGLTCASIAVPLVADSPETSL